MNGRASDGSDDRNPAYQRALAAHAIRHSERTASGPGTRRRQSAPALRHLVASDARPSLARGIGGSLASIGIHAALLAVAVAATLGTPKPGQASRTDRDTTLLFLEPVRQPDRDRQPDPVEQADTPSRSIVALSDAVIQGFQTLVAPAEVPTELPPIDVGVRFDPRDYSAKGAEGGLFDGAPDGTQRVDSRRLFSMHVVDEIPQLVNQPALHYPPMLRQMGVEGYVMVEYIVGAEGGVEEESLKIVKATNRHFVSAARAAVLDSRFRPGRIGGVPVRVRVQQTIEFDIL